MRVTALNAIQTKVKAVKAMTVVKVTVVTAATATVTQGAETTAGARIMAEE